MVWGQEKSTTSYFEGGHTRSQCAYCVIRHKSLCHGVLEQDIEGSLALDASHAPVRVYDAGDMIYGQGDPSKHVFNLISGWVALHRDMVDGRRQITRFLLPGAMFGVEPTGQDLGHGATAITNASACPIMKTKLDDLRRQVPSLNEQFIWMLAWDNHHVFETLATIGQGSAKERIGRLLGELVATAAGETLITAGADFKIPLTQRHIAEATGLTSIHVNRVLRQLREDRVVEFHNGTLTVIDPEKLSALTERGADSILSSAAGTASGLPSTALFDARLSAAPRAAAKAF